MDTNDGAKKERVGGECAERGAAVCASTVRERQTVHEASPPGRRSLPNCRGTGFDNRYSERGAADAVPLLSGRHTKLGERNRCGGGGSLFLGGVANAYCTRG